MDKMIFGTKFMKGIVNKVLTKLLVNKIKKIYPGIDGNPEIFIDELDFTHGEDKTKLHIEGDIYMSSELFEKLLTDLI